MKKVLVLPGWMTSLKLYKNNINDFDMSFGKLSQETQQADYVIGVSVGSLVVLKEINHLKGKIILINPPLPKRNIFIWFLQWVKYIIGGLFVQRQKFTLNPIRWLVEIIRCTKLLGTDFSYELTAFSKDRLIIIRSKSDNYFCDQSAVNFLRSKNIKVVEIEGGHNWNQNTEEEMIKLAV